MLIWLQVKHFMADYVLQAEWMIGGKGNLRKAGPYAHAGIHAVATTPILWLSIKDSSWIVVIACGEFLVHFLIDHLKAIHGHRQPHPMNTRSFWVLHGADQLAHHLTYSAILAITFWHGNLPNG
ncbi:DUF3307 domain-containing protein [Rhizobium bangladeshense]|uniref:DUF3307 domain-containing protein n=2 Tax=Rhizobium bangladeshense TaxID=1138189 RepID=A0ABS7LN83_9HYPH|nr:DUF3307 domain-containing protein [Rhizobium bangladeshense]MBX4886430.1 DUF3307 domain-containing protein [Rhizobium bangladeshense]MBX4904693.1 DUF3307 domain-containing protein [Rhizobium bangladeshense]MBX4916858.1 DUF3307 domain-containing protein [Rhizobium bangladeshense]MBX4923000.1 DUF3307 domain-containing protein [Rhizobium bangladeshense]